MTEIGKRAQEIINRIGDMDLARPILDKQRSETAIKLHLEALGIKDRPVRWLDEPSAALDALDALDARAARAALDALDALDARAARAALDARAARAARAARWYYWRWNAFYSMREAVYWVAASEASEKVIPEVEKVLGVWLPFVDAYEAGLWLYWILNDEVLALSRPVMHVAGQQLHREDGPAVHWPGGEKYFFLNGVDVPEEVVMTPASSLNPQLILKEENAEVRREIVRKIGIERVCEGLGAKCIDKVGNYELLILDLGDGRQRPFLKMLNPSIGVYHIEGVHPDCATVQESLNFRNGLTADLIDDENGAYWIQQGDVILRPRGETKFKSLPIVLT